MNYLRVIPRDLFNEGRLLTDLGHLSIAILDNKEGIAEVLDMSLEDAIYGFTIGQDESDGSIYVCNLNLRILNNLGDINLYSSCNCKCKNSLMFRYKCFEGQVFNNFEYSKDFREFLDYVRSTPH